MSERQCPRCGANRPDDFRWCRKCGLDFEASPKSVSSTPPRVIEPARTGSVVTQERPAIDIRPVNDRANMARMARDEMDVRCLGTVGGIVGAFAGFLVVGWLGMAIGGAGVLLALVGIPVGWWVGVRTVLGLMAR